MTAPSEIVLRLAPQAVITVAPQAIVSVQRRGDKAEVYIRGSWLYQPVMVLESVEEVCAKVEAAFSAARRLAATA
jgi:hypothetical protein